jgi:hypothetical protein
VNLSKPALVPVGSLGDADQLAGLLGCGTGTLPLKYLGLPLGASFKLKTMWVELEDLMARRLAPWKRSYLSKGGRVTLIKSTLSNLPTIYCFLSQLKWLSVLRRFKGISCGGG